MDRVDKARANQEFADLRRLAATLPEPSATLLRYVNDRDVIHLGARVLPHVESYVGAAPLSPSKSPKPLAPVFLLHGADDNVIPALESKYLADDVRGSARPTVLVTSLISHAAVERPPRFGEVVELASFWGDLLNR
jgi:pimeloyl-ACP methyl ester carboxylesterase